jgi:hypothetical protein
MAIVTLNPIISSVKNRRGNEVFYRRFDKQFARSYVIPRNPDTIAQRGIRKTFADAVKSWQALTSEEKYKFTRKARSLQMSGYNLYISKFMKEHIPTVQKSASELNSFIKGISSSGNMLLFHSVSASDIMHLTEVHLFRPLKASPG